MRLTGLRKGLGELKADNLKKNTVIVLLAVTNLLAVLGWYQKDEIVRLVPAHLEKTEKVGSSTASEGYREAFALMVAQLSGNITPGNADFVKASLGNLLSPSAYRAIEKTLSDQIVDIKRDSLTVSFEPRQVVHEPETDKIFVTGEFASQGVSGKPIKVTRTYEMIVDIRFGRPWITEFKPYQGSPVTADTPAGDRRTAANH